MPFSAGFPRAYTLCCGKVCMPCGSRQQTHRRFEKSASAASKEVRLTNELFTNCGKPRTTSVIRVARPTKEGSRSTERFKRRATTSTSRGHRKWGLIPLLLVLVAGALMLVGERWRGQSVGEPRPVRQRFGPGDPHFRLRHHRERVGERQPRGEQVRLPRGRLDPVPDDVRAASPELVTPSRSSGTRRRAASTRSTT